MKALLKYYVHSQLLIATCAALMYAMSSHFYNGELNLDFALFICSSTFLLYNAHRLIGKSLFGSKLTAQRFEHFKDSRALFIVSVVISFGYCLYFFISHIAFFLNWKLVAVPLVFSILYVVPVFQGKRLRDLAFIKIFVIAIVWTWVTVYWIDGIDLLNSRKGMILLVERFLFILAITVPFDIRDENIDRESGVETLVHLLGASGAKLIALGFLILPIVLMLYYLSAMNYAYIVSYAITSVVAGILIWQSAHSKNEEYFGGYIDGLMILFSLLYFALIWL